MTKVQAKVQARKQGRSKRSAAGVAHAKTQHCPATRSDGSPCTAVTDGGPCIGHVEGADAARAKGGHARSNASRAERMLPDDLRPVLKKILNAIDDVYAGKLHPQALSSMASGTGAAVKVIQLAEQEQRLREQEERLEAIERKLKREEDSRGK